MNKLAWAIVLLALAAFIADQHFNNCQITEDMVQTLQRMLRIFGW